MGILSSVLSFALCAIVYVRMLKREVPEPMGKKQAITISFKMKTACLKSTTYTFSRHTKTKGSVPVW